MKKISSDLIFLRYIFPVLWFGVLLGMIIHSYFIQDSYEKNIATVIIPIVMIVVGYFTHKELIWNLIEEVYDCGDHLLLKNRGYTEKILLSEIKNISVSKGTNPPQATLKLAKECRFGDEITFSPTMPLLTLNAFSKNEIIEGLIDRVHRARRTK